MKDKYLLALDQGTTSSRAIVFDTKGNTVSMAQLEYPQIYPKEGWVEHNPLNICSSQTAVMKDAVARAGLGFKDISAIGITNQRETTVVWDKTTGEPIYNAIVWQCRRTAARCDFLKASGLTDKVYEKTGLPIDPYFSATKLEWILDNVDGARSRAENGELLFGTVDTYLMWTLSGGKIFATDYTNASRTMLFNIHTLDWDDELLKLFNVPRKMLPEVHPSGYLYGYTDERFGGVPITGVAGDQQAALFGQKCFSFGECKNTFGTGCFLLMNVGGKAPKSKHGLITTLAAGLGKPDYALEGSVFVGGAVVQWLRDSLKMINSASETEGYFNSVNDTLGMYIVPAFTGLGAPYWDAYARGTITGITRGTTKEHFIRAALESIVYQVYDVVRAMEKDCGSKINRLAVDGGAAVNNALMQFTADIIGCDTIRPATVETTAFGAYYLAGLASGLMSFDDVKKPIGAETTFKPQMPAEKRERLLSGWSDAVKRARG